MNVENPLHGGTEIGHVKVMTSCLNMAQTLVKLMFLAKLLFTLFQNGKGTFEEFENLVIRDIETIHIIH